MSDTTVNELNVKIKGDSTSFQNAVNQSQLSIKKLTASMLIAQISLKAVQKVAQAVTQNIGSAISRVDTINNFSNVMGNLGISSSESEKAIKKLQEKLTGLPTTLDNAVNSVKRFTSANNNIQASTEMFLALNNAILAGGTNAQTQASALEQISQAYSKGKPDMIEWRSMLTAMPAQLKQVSIALGYVSTEELGEALRSGTLSMEEFMTTIIKLNKEGINGFASFEEQAKNSTNGIQTSMTNCKTAIVRGLSEILNAIGQTNIASFFTNITKAINLTIPYITAFVKICMQAISYVSILFGGKAIKTGTNTMSSLSSEAENTSNALNNVGTSAHQASDGIDNATGSAKNLKKELLRLAGFDKMTVLKEQDNTSSSGSSSTGSVGNVRALSDIGLGDFIDESSTQINRVDEIVEKFKNKFSTLINAVKVFASTCKPLFEEISRHFKWLWDNVFKPFNNWAVNELLPDFIKLLSSVVKVLGTILKIYNHTFETFLESFLIPLGKWTGKIIIKALESLTNVIEWFNAKISQSKKAQKILEDIGAVLLALVSSITVFVATVKLITGIVTVITTVVTLFTSFITISKTVIAIVGALVNCFVGAGGLTTGLIGVQVVFTQFCQVLGVNPYVMLIAGTVALSTGLAVLIAHFQSGSKEARELNKALKEQAEKSIEVWENYEKLRKTQEEKAQSNISEIAHVENLTKELQGLADEQGNVAQKDEARVEFILNELNKALGTEYTLIDGQISKYSELKNTIEEQIQTKKTQIYLEAQEELYREALCNWTQIQTEREKAKQEVEEATNTLQEKNSKANQTRLKNAMANYEALNLTYENYATDIQTYENAMTENLKGNFETAQEIIKNKGRVLKEFNGDAKVIKDEERQIYQTQYENAIKDLQNYIDNYSKGVEGYTADNLATLREFTNNAYNEAVKTGCKTDEGLVNGLNEKSWEVINSVEGIANNTNQTFENTTGIQGNSSTVFEGFGGNLIQGIIDGMNKLKNTLSSAVKNLAKNFVVDPIKKALQINSPSKLFYRFGEYIDSGLANGIYDGSSYVTKSMQSLEEDIRKFDFSNINGGNVEINRDVKLTNNLNNSNLISAINDLIQKENQTNVVVKIGDEVITDKVVEKMKNRNFVTNGGYLW